MTETIRAGRRTIEVTSPGKALFPKPKITKLELARHYERVAAAMLPHISRRTSGFPGSISRGRPTA